jgi:hypothetical protein
MQTKTYATLCQPGVKRDGTIFEGNFHSDAQHCRWMRGLPRKMGGYRLISDGFHGPIRGVHVSSANGVNSIHTGSAGYVERIQVDNAGFGAGVIDRTPVGFVSDSTNLWQFDSMYDSAGANTVLIASPTKSLANIDNSNATTIYYGDITANTALTSLSQTTDGGIVVLHPYLVIYGSNGRVSWSDANLPATFTGGSSGSARVTSSKIVYGHVLRGGPGYSPAGLLWSLDSVIRMSFVGGGAVFRFDTLSDQSSILSSQGVIEYDGVYFWAGVDRFLMYNGVVREVPNQMNLNWFFDGLNYEQRQKVWATKVPRFGEIWWFYPRGTATECTHAVVYNVRENTWYDSEMPRTSGHFAQVMRYPVWAAEGDSATTAELWQHDVGTDKVIGALSLAIPSWFETSDISMMAGGAKQGAPVEGIDRWTEVSRVEPDLNQVGEMTLTISGRKYARSDNVTSSYAVTPTTEKIDMRKQFRELRIKFESNTQGGFYEMGQSLFHLGIGDGRQ